MAFLIPLNQRTQQKDYEAAQRSQNPNPPVSVLVTFISIIVGIGIAGFFFLTQ